MLFLHILIPEGIQLILKVKMLNYEAVRAKEHEWIKLGTRQPEQGNVEGSAQLVRCSRNDGGIRVGPFLLKPF